MDTQSFLYCYPFASHLETSEVASYVRLAAFSPRPAEHECGELFSGQLRAPEAFCRALLALSEIVAWNELAGYVSRAQRDPVVTGHDEVLRFEGFSATCSMHVRLDVTADAFRSARLGRGTTNVDLNQTMRTALRRVRDRHETHLRVTRDRLTLRTAGHQIVERKVDLPDKWLRAFCELPSEQRTLLPRIEIEAREARTFLRSLPRKPPRRPWYVVARGGILQSSLKESSDAVPLAAASRLRLLEPLLESGTHLRVWSNDNHTSLWEVVDGPRRFSLLLAANPYRGFSAGGAVLADLAAPRLDSVSRVRAALSGQARLEPHRLGRTTGVSGSEVEAALSTLGSQGLLGFDHDSMTWFHRELPFDRSAIDRLHPRVASARRLLAERRVIRLDGGDFEVRGNEVVHFVRLRREADTCSCTWFSTHGRRLGPCKHILAASQLQKET
jgi:hypothetical protein